MSTILFKGLGIEVTFSPGAPGCIYGPPENCYEAEPDEIEIDEIWIENQDEYEEWFGPVVDEDTQFLRDLVDDDLYEIIEKAREAYDDEYGSYFAGDDN